MCCYIFRSCILLIKCKPLFSSLTFFFDFQQGYCPCLAWFSFNVMRRNQWIWKKLHVLRYFILHMKFYSLVYSINSILWFGHKMYYNTHQTYPSSVHVLLLCSGEYYAVSAILLTYEQFSTHREKMHTQWSTQI